MAKKSDFNTSRSVKDLQAEYGKMPPQAVDLEEAVLGALMLERDAFSIVGDLLEPDAFYKDAHQKIFRAIHKLFLNDDPVDLLTVSEAWGTGTGRGVLLFVPADDPGSFGRPHRIPCKDHCSEIFAA